MNSWTRLRSVVHWCCQTPSGANGRRWSGTAGERCRVAGAPEQRGQADEGDALDEGGCPPARRDRSRACTARLARSGSMMDSASAWSYKARASIEGLPSGWTTRNCSSAKARPSVGVTRVRAGLRQTEQGHPGLVRLVMQPGQPEHLGMIAEAVVEPADVQRDHPARAGARTCAVRRQVRRRGPRRGRRARRPGPSHRAPSGPSPTAPHTSANSGCRSAPGSSRASSPQETTSSRNLNSM